MILVKRLYYKYYTKKSSLKKFLAKNNIDLENILEKFKELIKIKKMLINQVFTVIIVYKL